MGGGAVTVTFRLKTAADRKCGVRRSSSLSRVFRVGVPGMFEHVGKSHKDTGLRVRGGELIAESWRSQRRGREGRASL